MHTRNKLLCIIIPSRMKVPPRAYYNIGNSRGQAYSQMITSILARKCANLSSKEQTFAPNCISSLILGSKYDISGVGRGGGCRNAPPPKSKKLLQKSGVIFQRSILSGRSHKSEKYLLKHCEKNQFSIEILIKKSQYFLEIFQNYLHFWSKRAKFANRLLSFSAQSKSFIRSSVIYQNIVCPFSELQ